METKNFNEIKKQFKITNCSISKIRGCYVDSNKEKASYINENFLNLPEEEQHKYLEIFKKTLSGGVGKCLLDMVFKESDKQKSLLALRDSSLKNDDILDAFYDNVINTISYVGNYLILLADQVYDVPTKTEDGMKIDESESVYHYIICAICPMELPKAGLGYNEENKEFHNIKRSFMVNAPIMGFLYPAFNDRMEDRDAIVLYTKNHKTIDSGFVDGCLGCEEPSTAEVQNNIFVESLSEALGNKCTYEMVENISKSINDLSQSDTKENLTEKGIGYMLKSSGLEVETVDKFEDIFVEKAKENGLKDKEVNINNILPDKKTTYEINDIKIKANEEQNASIDVRKIDGKLCLVIETTEDIVVNGIAVKE